MRPGHPAVVALLDAWSETRAALAEIARKEHPDIVDRHGRAWRWKTGGGDLYSHDDTLSVTADMVAGLALPPATLSDNHNYWQLCAICTSQWSDEDRARLKANREEFLATYGGSS